MENGGTKLYYCSTMLGEKYFFYEGKEWYYEYGKLDDIVWCSRSYITITLFTELLKSVLFIWELEEKFIVLGLSLKLTNNEFKL